MRAEHAKEMQAGLQEPHPRSYLVARRNNQADHRRAVATRLFQSLYQLRSTTKKHFSTDKTTSET